MKLQDCIIRCQTCKHEFPEKLVVECAVMVFAAALKAMRCPKCNGKKLSLVKTEPVE